MKRPNTVSFAYDGNNNPLVTYSRGLDLSGSLGGAVGIGGLLARTDASGTAYYHSDLGGNVTAMAKTLTNLTNGVSHVLVAKYLYDPFGNQLGQWGPLADANKYRFSSKEYHANSQLYYYGFRWYEPELQRWLNRDPLGELFDANLYRFVYNSPVSYVDPNGEFGILATGAIGAGVGAAVGAGVALYTGGDVLQGALHGAVVGGLAGLGAGIGSALVPASSAVAGMLGGALGGGLGDAAGQSAELAMGWRCEYDPLQTALSAGLGGAFGGAAGALGRGAVPQVLRNKAAGNAFRDELAYLLRQEGRDVATEVYKRTPFGKRFIDIEVSLDGTVLGGIETKVGGSRYKPLQRMKDDWLRRTQGYTVNIARDN